MAFYDIDNRCYLRTFFIFALIETLLCSGITYGWANIVVVFKLEHFYLRLCRPFYKEHNTTFPDMPNVHDYDPQILPGCPAQDSMFNLIFNLSVLWLSVIKLAGGILVDKCGPRFTRTVGGYLYVAAALGMGFVTVGYEGFLFPVFFCICIGGGILVVSVFHVCNVIYGNTKLLVICVINGAMDSSAVVLLIFQKLYENGVDMKFISLIYAALCSLLILMVTLILIPPRSTLLNCIDEESEMHHQNDQGERNLLLANSESVEKGSVFQKDSVLQSICSSLYIMEVIFLAIFQLRLWYFVGSLPDFLGRLSHNNKDIVSHYTSLFGYIQFGGLVVTPFIGVIFDWDSFFQSTNDQRIITAEEKRQKKLKQCIAPFIITMMLCVIFSVLSLFEDIRLQIPQYVLFTIVRGFVYANHGSYIAIAFPAYHFGTLLGLGVCIAGCVGLFEYALFELSSGPLEGDPYYTNVILLILVLFANMHPINLWRYCRAEGRLKEKLSP